MRHFVKRVIFTLGLSLTFLNTHATKVFPAERKCPVCLETFITMELGSYSSFGESERDLSDSPAIVFDGVEICPYCLFASLKSDFDRPSLTERKNLRAKLPTISVGLQKPERIALLATPENNWLWRESFLGLLLARQCYSWCRPDAARDMTVLLHLYYSSTGDCSDNLHRYYRQQCLNTLSALLVTHTYQGTEEAVFTYLLGELNRRDGREEEAVRLYAKASALAQALPAPKNNDEASSDWIVSWAFEQTCRIQFATNSVQSLASLINAPESKTNTGDNRCETMRKVAIQTLAARQDVEAWSALAAYIMQDPPRLDTVNSFVRLTAEKLKIDVKLWAWVEQRYQEALRQTKKFGQDADITWIRTKNQFYHLFTESESSVFESEDDEKKLASAFAEKPFPYTLLPHQLKPGEMLSSISIQHRTTTKRILELNPSIKNPNKIIPPLDIWCPEMPLGWSEQKVLNNLTPLLQAGNTNAISFFFGWMGTVGENTFESSSSYRLCHNLAALATAPTSWRVPDKERLAGNPQQIFLRDCLALIHGNSDIERHLLNHVVSGKEPEASIALASLGAIRNPVAKATVLSRLEKTPDDHFDEFAALSYLKAVATPEDLPTLKRIARSRCPSLSNNQHRDLSAYNRRDIETAMKVILLRSVIKRSLSE